MADLASARRTVDWMRRHKMPASAKILDELIADVERLSAREQELWDRESLAMSQRDAAEALIEKVFEYCVDSSYDDINPHDIAELIGRGDELQTRREAVHDGDD